MNQSPAWFAQRYPPGGAVAGDGIQKQLGTPQLDPLEVLVREAAQNSWDAKLSAERSISFCLYFSTLRDEKLHRWRTTVGEGEHLDTFQLQEVLRDDEVTVLTVSDRRTTGLGGPTRSDQATGEDPDFVNFIRNVGEPRDTELGGGFDGFGKGSLSCPLGRSSWTPSVFMRARSSVA